MEKQIEECTVKAPISGVITSLNVEEGDSYSSTNNSAIAVIENIGAYEVEAEIDEYDISKIAVGQTVVIKTNGTGETELAGTVSEVAPRATSTDSTNSDVTYKVTISIDTPCEDLRMDMTASVSESMEAMGANNITVGLQQKSDEEESTEEGLQFIVESIVICLMGGIIGIILGITLGMGLANLLDAAAKPSINSIVMSLTFSMAIGVFFGYYPANKAAKMDPIEALRYE